MMNNKGSLTLELAIITPILIILVVGSIFLGVTYINKAALMDASFIGAKSASYYGGDTDEVRADIYDSLNTRFLAGRDSVQVTVKYTAADSTEYSQTQAADILTVPTPLPAMPGTKITVELVYNNYNMEIPLMPTNTFNMKGYSVSRNTNP